MKAILLWLTSPEWGQIVKALLHSLWQGGVLAVLLGLTLRRVAMPALRYRLAVGALGALLGTMLLTWALLNTSANRQVVPAQYLPHPPTSTFQASSQPNSPKEQLVLVAPGGKAVNPSPEHPEWTAWLALAWLFGALLMLTRAGVQVAGAERLRRSGQPLEDATIANLIAEAQRAVRLTCRIRVTVTDTLTSPAVVGVLVPTLILPLSLLTTLTHEQLRFVFLHELAHIRRGDYFTNLVQLLIEALLFFNPAVWWISQQVRREREACCDAWAIELSGAPADYARTLLQVAERALHPAPVAAAAFGERHPEPSSLADRVQRLLVPGYRPVLRLTWRAMLMSLVVGSMLLVLSALGTRNTVGAILADSEPTALASETARTIVTTNAPSEISTPRSDVSNNVAQPALRIRSMTSDNSVHFDIATGITSTTNRSELSYGAVRITADSLIANQETGEVVATGNVVIRDGKTNAAGARMQYNFKTKRLKLTGQYGIQSTLSHSTKLETKPTSILVYDGFSEGGLPSLLQSSPQFSFDYRSIGVPATNKANVLSPVSNARLRAPSSLQSTEWDRYLAHYADGGYGTAAKPVRGNPGRRAILEKLNKIRLDQVFFEGVTFGEVIHKLSEASKKHDPEGIGVTFVYNSLPGPSNEGAYLKDLPIKINPALANITLKDVLDIVVQVAERPIRYSVEDFGVLFSVKNSTETLFRRGFKIDAQTFAKLSERAAGIPADDIGDRTTGHGILTLPRVDPREGAGIRAPNVLPSDLPKTREGGGIRFLTRTNTMEATHNSMRTLLSAIGVDFYPPKSVFYSDTKGILLVNATLSDLDAIETMLLRISNEPVTVPPDATPRSDDSAGSTVVPPGKSPHILIEARFIELADFNPDNEPGDSPLRILPKATSTNNTANNTKPSKSAAEFRAKFGQKNNLILETISPPTVTRALTEPQTAALLERFNSQSGTDILFMPKVITPDNRQAQVQVVDIRTIVTSAETNVSTSANGKPQAEIKYHTEDIPFGPVLDVVPSRDASEDQKINLQLLVTITEFIGYDDPGKFSVSVAVPGGKPVSGQRPLPRVRLRELDITTAVKNGQSLLLGGPISTEVKTLKAKVPLLGDIPLLGHVFRSTRTSTVKKHLVVLVKATMVDDKGQPFQQANHR